MGESVPVAFWLGPRVAAVLHVRRVYEDDEPEPWAETDVHLLVRVEGGWRPVGGGGAGGWSDDALVPREVPATEIRLDQKVAAQDGDGGCSALWGEVGSESAHAEVEQSGVVTRHRVVAPLGFYVVAAAAHEPFTVRVRDRDGRILAEIHERNDWLDEPLG